MTLEASMPYYVISYDLRNKRNYQPLYDVLNEWKAARLLESLWLAHLKGPATAVRDILKAKIDSDDGLAVVELANDMDWGAIRAQKPGVDWLKKHSP